MNPRGGGLGALFSSFAPQSISLASFYVQIFSLFLIYCSLAVSGCTRYGSFAVEQAVGGSDTGLRGGFCVC